MEKTRVKKRERYWFINSFGEVVPTIECGVIDDVKRFKAGNYFHTKEEAETVARKLCAVLNGAEVIEPLNENDILKAIADFDALVKYLDEKGLGYTNIKDAQAAFLVGIQWRNSKIVK